MGLLSGDQTTRPFNAPCTSTTCDPGSLVNQPHHHHHHHQHRHLHNHLILIMVLVSLVMDELLLEFIDLFTTVCFQINLDSTMQNYIGCICLTVTDDCHCVSKCELTIWLITLFFGSNYLLRWASLDRGGPQEQVLAKRKHSSPHALTWARWVSSWIFLHLFLRIFRLPCN